MVTDDRKCDDNILHVLVLAAHYQLSLHLRRRRCTICPVRAYLANDDLVLMHPNGNVIVRCGVLVHDRLCTENIAQNRRTKTDLDSRQLLKKPFIREVPHVLHAAEAHRFSFQSLYLVLSALSEAWSHITASATATSSNVLSNIIIS